MSKKTLDRNKPSKQTLRRFQNIINFAAHDSYRYRQLMRCPVHQRLLVRPRLTGLLVLRSNPPANLFVFISEAVSDELPVDQKLECLTAI